MHNLNSIKNQFKTVALFEQSLTHRSWLNENGKIRGSNERLEFLGDAVLEYIVSKELYSAFPKEEEGFLTNLRANIVNTTNLALVAEKLDLGEHVLLSKGERLGGGGQNASLLADTVEAIIGAIFLDQGLQSAEEFIKLHLLSDIEEKLKAPLKDAKSRLQESVQAQGYSTPKYSVLDESGPDHAKEFTVQVVVDSKVIGQGQGKSKNQAEQDAASNALENLTIKK